MELYKEILLNLLSEYKVEVSFKDAKINVAEIIEGKCYKALCEIKEIIHDTSLDDCECVEKIERIICCFENIGSSGGIRHDG